MDSWFWSDVALIVFAGLGLGAAALAAIILISKAAIRGTVRVAAEERERIGRGDAAPPVGDLQRLYREADLRRVEQELAEKRQELEALKRERSAP